MECENNCFEQVQVTKELLVYYASLLSTEQRKVFKTWFRNNDDLQAFVTEHRLPCLCEANKALTTDRLTGRLYRERFLEDIATKSGIPIEEVEDLYAYSRRKRPAILFESGQWFSSKTATYSHLIWPDILIESGRLPTGFSKP
ncbi:MAG: hypothetical protein K2Z81_19835 [Cyanobacteria bacterium]|nr:hypothetical protein [Cyanobacteriota bacterium]